MIGQTISHYRILEKLGGGGMGVVYRAEDTKLKRTVALKFLPPELTSDPEAKERFIHEAQAASALDHNNICTIHEIGETDDGRMFIAMACYDGETLKKKIEHGPLKMDEALDTAIQIALGLAKTHEKGIVHRDIKPANVLTTADNVVKIVDFGLAKLAGQTKLTKTGSTLGTTAYMSPEQARGEEVDARTDIWSLGVVMYEMITGRLPFRSEYQDAVVYSIVNEDPEPMTGLRTGVPMELEHIVNKALAKDRNERYQHIDEMLVDLKRAKKESDTREILRFKPHREAAQKKWSKLRVAAIASVAAVVVLVVVLILNPFGGRISDDRGEDTSSKTLAVMYFDNIPDPEDKDHTGEMLTRVMINALTQTKGLEVISRERLYDIQNELDPGGSKRIGAPLALKIAQRSGAVVMLTGNILQSQPQLAVTTQLIDVKSGKILGSQRVRPYERDQIFSLADSLSFLVRNVLNLAPSSLGETKFTTSSPEAYRAYVEGDELVRRFLPQDAKPVLERAIEIDSKFAMAYSALAQANFMLRDGAGGTEAIRKAWELRNNVTELERLLIESRYHSSVEGNPAKAARALEDLLRRYPHYQNAYNLLFSTYVDLFEYERAQQVLSRGLRRDSLDRRLLNQTAYLCAAMNQKEKSLKAIEQFLKISPAEANAYDSKGEIYHLFGDVDSAVYWYKKANSLRGWLAGRKLAYDALLKGDYRSAREYFKSLVTDTAVREYSSALILMHQGRLKASQKDLLKILPSHQARGFQDAVSTEYSYLMFLSSELRNYDAMVNYAQKKSDELKKSPTNVVYGRDLVAWAWMKSGDAGKWSALIDNIEDEIRGKPPRWQMAYDYGKGLISFERGDFENSVKEFEKAFQFRLPNFAPDYHYGVALLKTGHVSSGIRELERVTKWFPIIWGPLNILFTNLYWPIAAVKAHYWLGVAYEQQGDARKAIKEYETFLDTWKHADFRSPEMEDATMRLKRLKGEK